MPMFSRTKALPDEAPPLSRADSLRLSVAPGVSDFPAPYRASLDALYTIIDPRLRAELCTAFEALITLVGDLPEPNGREPFGFFCRQLGQALRGAETIKNPSVMAQLSQSLHDRDTWSLTTILAGLGLGLGDIRSCQLTDKRSGLVIDYAFHREGFAFFEDPYNAEWRDRQSAPGLYTHCLLTRGVCNRIDSKMMSELWAFWNDPADKLMPLGQVFADQVSTGYAESLFDSIREYAARHPRQINNWPSHIWVKEGYACVAYGGMIYVHKNIEASPWCGRTIDDITQALVRDRITSVRHGRLHRDCDGNVSDLDLLCIPMARIWRERASPRDCNLKGIDINMGPLTGG